MAPVYDEEDVTDTCPVCGSEETVEIGDETQTITVCGECGYDGP